MKRFLIVALLLLPFVLPWCLRAETAEVYVGATLGSSVTVELDGNAAFLRVEGAAPADVFAWVEVTGDGPARPVELVAAAWTCLYACPVRPAPEPPALLALRRR